jgi:hypothetical protein
VGKQDAAGFFVRAATPPLDGGGVFLLTSNRIWAINFLEEFISINRLEEQQ